MTFNFSLNNLSLLLFVGAIPIYLVGSALVGFISATKRIRSPIEDPFDFLTDRIVRLNQSLTRFQNKSYKDLTDTDDSPSLKDTDPQGFFNLSTGKLKYRK